MSLKEIVMAETILDKMWATEDGFTNLVLVPMPASQNILSRPVAS